MAAREPTPPGARVIRRKIIVPPVPARLATRDRLDRLILDLVSRHTLVWVCATAGSGKTTAVAQALDRQARPVAWLTLDDTDAAAGRLLSYLEASLALAVDAATGVTTRALAARLPHVEAAGLLAKAVGEVPVILVLDEVERIADAPAALAVVAAIVRYAPRSMCVVLICRKEVPIKLDSSTALSSSAAITEADLTFRTTAAAHALALAGRADIDPNHAVEVTGGWVAGVLFEAWRSSDHVTGIGGEADALHGYLSSQILDRLAPEDRDFLVTTSVLDDVTAERAQALGELDAAARLVSLRARHLPVAWRHEGR